MHDYQMFSIIGANVAVLMTFMGISIALIIHMNKRIDRAMQWPNERKDHGRKRRL